MNLGPEAAMSFCNRLSAVALLAATMMIAAAPIRAAELVLFESKACPWCATFDHEVGMIYAKTAEGRRAPLRRVDITKALPADIAFIEVERLTPLFVLIDKDREIGRIRGYPGEDHFWGLLGILMKRLDAAQENGNTEKQPSDPLHASR